MSENLIKRLRNMELNTFDGQNCCDEAADEIERLRGLLRKCVPVLQRVGRQSEIREPEISLRLEKVFEMIEKIKKEVGDE